jgi:hypothetical protein
LMNDAALLGPVMMQRENEILEGHEQSSRCYGGLNSCARRVEMSGEINRMRRACQGTTPLGSTSCGTCLCRMEWMDIGDQSPMNYSAQVF